MMKKQMKHTLLLLTALTLIPLATIHGAEVPAQPVAVKSVKRVIPAQAGLVVENTGRVFARQVQQRCDAKVITTGAAPLTVELAIEKGIGAEGYRIEDRPGGGVRIVGNDERGVLYGAGKFLRSSRYMIREVSRPVTGVAHRCRNVRCARSI